KFPLAVLRGQRQGKKRSEKSKVYTWGLHSSHYAFLKIQAGAVVAITATKDGERQNNTKQPSFRSIRLRFCKLLGTSGDNQSAVCLAPSGQFNAYPISDI